MNLMSEWGNTSWYLFVSHMLAPSWYISLTVKFKNLKLEQSWEIDSTGKGAVKIVNQCPVDGTHMEGEKKQAALSSTYALWMNSNTYIQIYTLTHTNK